MGGKQTLKQHEYPKDRKLYASSRKPKKQQQSIATAGSKSQKNFFDKLSLINLLESDLLLELEGKVLNEYLQHAKKDNAT